MNGLISWCLLLHLRPRLSTQGPPQPPVQARALRTCRETALCRAHTALGDYKATGDGLDAALDANAKASYVSAAPPARPRFSGCTNAVPCNLSIS